jgi:hypothetical protein
MTGDGSSDFNVRAELFGESGKDYVVRQTIVFKGLDSDVDHRLLIYKLLIVHLGGPCGPLRRRLGDFPDGWKVRRWRTTDEN